MLKVIRRGALENTLMLKVTELLKVLILQQVQIILLYIQLQLLLVILIYIQLFLLRLIIRLLLILQRLMWLTKQ